MLEKPVWLVNFELSDFQCHCEACAQDDDRPFSKMAVLACMQALRSAMGKPLVITRGVSCADHNRAVGGAGDSRHLPEHADAIDLAVQDPHEAFEIVAAALKQGAFTAYRVYPHHVHLDLRGGDKIFLASPE